MKKAMIASGCVRNGRSAFLLILLACAVGFATSLLALPATVNVKMATQLEVMRGTQVSMRMPLAVGTNLDVVGVEGEYVLVRYRLTNGRVLAKTTDFPLAELSSTASVTEVAPPPPQPTAPPPRPSATPPRPSTAPARPATTATRPATTPEAVRVLPAPAPVEKRAPVVVHDDPLDAPAGKGLMMVVLCFLGACLVMMIANWRVYTKAGKPGWATLIPIYNLIVLLQISGKPVWWILLWFVPLVNLVIMVLMMFGLADNFGKGKGFALGLMLLPFLFLPLLAFGDAQYVGSGAT